MPDQHVISYQELLGSYNLRSNIFRDIQVISYQELLGSYNRNNGTWLHRPHIKMTTGKPIVRALRYTTISSDLIIAT